MGVSDHYRMPGHCWDRNPRTGIRCLDEPRHKGAHFNWFTRDRWPNIRAAKPAAQARG